MPCIMFTQNTIMFYKRYIHKTKQRIGSRQNGGKMDRNEEVLSGAAARTGDFKEKQVIKNMGI